MSPMANTPALAPLHLPRPFDPTGLTVAARLAAHGPWPDLWIQGDPTALAGPLVALVGTRSPDPYGVAFAQRLAAELARDGIGVLSGGALGIDAAAHRGALMGAGRTVVVLPAGLDHWYPRRHAGLYRDILAAGGCLVSQFAPETPPMHWTFPRRNHLVATLCDALVVVLNFSDMPRPNYRIGVPYPVAYQELLNSDARIYGGSGLTQPGGKAMAHDYASHGLPFSVVLDLAPFAGMVLKPAPLRLQ